MRAAMRSFRHTRKEIKVLLNRCFQSSYLLCVLCLCRSDYQWEMSCIMYDIETLMNYLYYKHCYTFPQLYTRVPDFRQWQDRINAGYDLQCQLYWTMRRANWLCGCIQLPRQTLDQIKSKIGELERQHIY